MYHCKSKDCSTVMSKETDLCFACWVRNMQTDAKQTEAMIRGYITAALWSSTDDDDTPLDSYCNGDNLAEASRAKIAEEVTNFLRKNRDDIAGFKEATGLDDESVGHDLWLTRNRHGTGFWDRKNGGEYAKRLTEAAQAMGERSLVACVVIHHEPA